MLELARIQPEAALGGALNNLAAPGGLVMGLARTNEELEAIQRLRYDVFTEEMNVAFPDAVDGLDSDRYDPWCEHFMVRELNTGRRSEEHTSELQSLMRISYAVFCLKNKINDVINYYTT